MNSGSFSPIVFAKQAAKTAIACVDSFGSGVFIYRFQVNANEIAQPMPQAIGWSDWLDNFEIVLYYDFFFLPTHIGYFSKDHRSFTNLAIAYRMFYGQG